jgi:hypothetical protein
MKMLPMYRDDPSHKHKSYFVKQDTKMVKSDIETPWVFPATYHFLLFIWSLHTICRWSIFISVSLSPLCGEQKQPSELSSKKGDRKQFLFILRKKQTWERKSEF